MGRTVPVPCRDAFHGFSRQTGLRAQGGRDSALKYELFHVIFPSALAKNGLFQYEQADNRIQRQAVFTGRSV